jgi:hypothetical protein
VTASPSHVRQWALTGARALLICGPIALAFYTGGYFAVARDWAGLGAWLLVAVALLARAGKLPRTASVRAALAGLALFAAWTLISTVWAPVEGDAWAAGQIAVLYLGGLLAAVLLLRNRRVLALLEPAVAAGTLIVVGYGLSERLLPGLLHFSRSVSAEGRLEQPLTYWNAMGELAALGLVLCARIAGDGGRRRFERAAAAGACAPLGMGLYLSFSRGAVFACVAGLVTLVFAAGRREQLGAVLLAAVAGALAAVACAPFGGLTSLSGSLATRERQGVIVLVLLAAVIAAAAFASRRLQRPERNGVLPLPRHSGLIALAVICIGLAIAIVVGAKEGGGSKLAPGASRLISLQSNRFDYWGVALRAFAAEPVRGVGAGGWAVWWLRYRTIRENAADAHSLELQTLAELGLVGLALLAVFLAGIALAARDAVRALPSRAIGLAAGFVVYIAHSPLDWDWQMPALTLFGLLLAGGLLALAELAAPATAPRRSAAPRV